MTLRSRLRAAATHPMLRGIGALAGGQAFGQLLALAMVPVLTRLYVPAEHGLFGLFLSFTWVAAPLVSLRYDAAVASVPDRAEAARLFAGAVLLTLPGAVLAAAFWWVLTTAGVAGFGAAAAADAPLAALAAAATGLYGAARFWLLREQQYGTAALVQLVQSAVRGPFQAALSWWPGGAVGLLLGDVLARAAGIGRMLRRSAEGLRLGLAGGIGPVAAALRRHRAFALWGAPSVLVNSLTGGLPIPLVLASYGATTAGLLALSMRVLNAPILLIGASTGDAFQVQFTADWARDPHAARRLFRRTGAGLAALSVAGTIIAMTAAEPLFGLAFGEDWVRAGRIAALQAPWMFAALTVSPLSRVIFVLAGQRAKLLYDVAGLVGLTAVWLWADRAGWSVEALIAAWSVLQVGLYALYYVILEGLIARRLPR